MNIIIGSSLYRLYGGKLSQCIVRLFGTEDFHSHLRVGPLMRFFESYPHDVEVVDLLEVGCGIGTNLFELSMVKSIRATGIDVNEKAIEAANRALHTIGFDHISFHCSDARHYTPDSEVDCLLFMDILEHLPEPGNLVNRLSRYLKKGGYVVVSVPTPIYPCIFGRQFHDEIGHLVDGYKLDDLSLIVPKEYSLVYYEYHTGLLTWPACFLYYRYFRNIHNELVRLVLGIFLVPFRWFDYIQGETSTSLFAVFQKPRN